MTRNFKLLVRDIAQDKSMVLFCGAGINCDINVQLSWPAVIETPFRLAINHIAREKGLNDSERMILHNIFSSKVDEQSLSNSSLRLRYDAANDFPYEIRSAILKAVHSRQYIPLLQEYIYSKCNKQMIRASFIDHYADNDKKDKTHPIKGYETPKDESPHPSFHTLYILAKFILLYDKVEAIVTYNYDNFLTEAIILLAKHPEQFFYKPEYERLIERWGKNNAGGLNVRVVDIYGKTYDVTIRKNYIPVFHVHGFIPPPGWSRNCESSSIVFSQDEYCDTVTNVQTWQNSTQMHNLCHYTCLFAGSSMTDLTVKRMIDFARNNGNEENIYNLDVQNIMPQGLKGEALEYARGKKLLSDLKRDYLANVGVKPIAYPGNHLELYEEFGKTLYLKSANKLKGQRRERN